jgi:titin
LPPVPNPPSDLVATAVSSEKIKLTWQDNSDNEDGFNIERKVEGGSYSRIGTVGADVTSYSDIGREIGGLEPGTTYCYRVRAYNAFDGSNPSNESCVTTPLGPPPTSPPEPPSDLVATAVSSGQIDLTWQDNSDNECGFKIERKVEGGSWTLIRTVGADVTSYSDTGAPTEDRLQPNTSYCYRVRAYNVVGDSSYSNGACATTPLPH